MGKHTSAIIEISTCYNLVNCTTDAVDYIFNGTANGIDLGLNLGKVVGQICLGEECVTGCWTITSATACDAAVNTYSIYNLYNSCEECGYCGCPIDYDTILDAEFLPVNCQQITTTPPTLNGTPITVTAGSSNPSFYGQYGTTFFANITANTYPLSAFTEPIVPGPQYGFRDANGILIGGSNTFINTGVWGSGVTSRLNTVGVWTSPTGGPPCDEWIGFSQCITLTETKTYCIGIAGDNRVRIKIDGIPIINAEIGLYTYFAWSVFEIDLTAGQHIIELEGYNNPGVSCAGNPASFGAEIYGVDSATLQTYTTQLQLDAPGVTIFSTLTKRTVPSTFDIGITNGYSCPEGYAYSSCDNACVKINTIPYINCCYQLLDCITSEVFFQFTYDGTVILGVPTPEQIGDRIINQITIDGITTEGCWSIVKSNTVTCPVVIDITPQPYSNITSITLTDSCISCRTRCVRLIDCAEIQDSIVVNFPDYLTSYIGKTIKFEITTQVISGWPVGTYCATVNGEDECEASIALNINGAITEYTTCLECNPQCYLLTDCTNPENILVILGDLSQYLDDVITIQGCKNICWKVSLADSCEGSIPAPRVLSFFSGENACTECAPVVPDPIPFVLHQRMVKPGYDTPGCSPEYTEKILCNYSEAMFDEMAKTRYGITICCDDGKDIDYWDIKRQVLEFKALTDSSACQVQFPCYSYELVNLDPLNDSVFVYQNCNAQYVNVIVTNLEGTVIICSTNLPVGTGGSPQVTKGILCSNEILP